MATERDRPPRSGDRSGGGRRPPGKGRDAGPHLAGPAQWGRVARRGAGGLDEDVYPSEDQQADVQGAPRRREKDHRSEAEDEDGPKRPPPHDRSLPTAEEFQRTATDAVSRSRGPRLRDRKPLGARPQRVEDPAVALKGLVGDQRAKRLARRLNEAGEAFEAERFKDARGVLQPLVKEAPGLAEARELLGLSYYRLGRWKDAIEEFEAFRELTNSTEQHPVLADCHRALGRWADVDALWSELGEASPSAALVNEGRIVVAGSKADQGDLAGAIRMLEQGWKAPKRPRGHHLRRAYALADLYERVGKAPRARELFKWVQRHDPQTADVAARVRALS